MTKLLERALASARGLPPDMQDELARMVMLFTGTSRPVADLTEDDEAAIAASREAAKQGDFVSDAEMRALWAKHEP